MIKDLLSELIESIINRYLLLDPNSEQRVQALNGKLIEIIITIPIRIKFYFQIGQRQLFLLNHCKAIPNVSLEGSLLSFIRIWQTKSTNVSQDLLITGDTQVALAFNHLVQDLDIDWEHYLQQYLGNTISHQMIKTRQKIIDFFSKRKDTLVMNTKEYLQEELKFLPTRLEINEFMHEVDRLLNDVARLEARLNQLASE